MINKRYDFAAYSAFTAYASCSLVIPIVLVKMGEDLNFPLDDGGMSSGGILHLARCLAMVFSLLSCGFIAGKFGKRMPMGLSLMLMGASIFGAAFAPAYWILIPLLLAAGFGEGICEGLATPFVQDLHPDNPEKYVNISHSFWSVGIGICVLGAGAMLSAGISWRTILIIAGSAAMAVSLLFICKESPRNRYPESPEKPDAAVIWQKTIDIFKQGRFWLYCAGMFTGAGAEFCLTFWAAAYLQLSFGASAFLAGTGTAAIALGMFCGRNVFGSIANERNLKKILFSAALGTIPLTILLALLKAEYFTSPAIFFAVIMSILFCCGIGIAPYWPTLQVHGVNRMPHHDSTLLYILFSAMGVPGCGFFTWIIGVLGDKYGLQGAFMLIPASLVVYIGILLVDTFLPEKK